MAHITINGRTYASVDEMPADVRRQYEAAMHFMAKSHSAVANASAGDVSISTTGSGPGHTFKTVATSRIEYNGREYAHWEELPPDARAAFQAAGVNLQMPFAPGTKQIADATQIASAYQLKYNSSSGITLSLNTLIIILIIVLMLGVCVGHFLH
jgi:hypothetical protein